MARRKKTSVVDILFDISATLPWWVSIIIAVMTYLVCHSFATAELPVAKNMAEFGPAIQKTILKSLATVLQYVLPVIFLIGAAASALVQAKRRGLSKVREEPHSGDGQFRRFWAPPTTETPKDDQFGKDAYAMWKDASVQPAPPERLDATRWSPELLTALDWKRFEEVCAGLFERLGFTAQVAAFGPDGGVDIRLFRPPAEHPVAIVQCKSMRKVGVEVVRALHGVMTSQRVPEGILASTGAFSGDAHRYGKDNHIDLMDGDAVLKSIRTLTSEQQTDLLKLATHGNYTTPTCASCGVKLIKRQPKSGGKPFWGCVNYPRCKTTMYLSKA